MDLGQFLLRQAQALQKQLQGLLEKSEAELPPPRAFEVTTDLSQLDSVGIGLPKDLGLRAPLLFTRFHPYFEGGVLFLKRNDGWSPVAAFQKGFSFNLTPAETELQFEFPELTLTEVKKARSQAIIQDLGLSEYLDNPKISALVFRPHPDYLCLVLSELPDPWLKLQIDKVQEKSLLLLVDYS